MNFDITFIEPVGKLIDVALKVLLAKGMVNTIETSFEHRPNTLHAIGVCHAIYELLSTVVHYTVVKVGEAAV